jgi:hypothetical protein
MRVAGSGTGTDHTRFRGSVTNAPSRNAQKPEEGIFQHPAKTRQLPGGRGPWPAPSTAALRLAIRTLTAPARDGNRPTGVLYPGNARQL